MINEEKKEKRAYVCSPCKEETVEGVKRNMEAARRYMEWVEKNHECRAFAPHGFLPPLLDDNDEKDRELAIDFCMAVLHSCDEMYVFGSRISGGMKKEIRRAVERNMPIFIADHLRDELYQWWGKEETQRIGFVSFCYDRGIELC